uniref:Ubiquitin carboxyl-terminal hydrolase 10-B n=1 Tax=Lygus hesperus TaxID=30085 RepID=A0A0A9WX46_LYGHE
MHNQNRERQQMNKSGGGAHIRDNDTNNETASGVSTSHSSSGESYNGSDDSIMEGDEEMTLVKKTHDIAPIYDEGRKNIQVPIVQTFGDIQFGVKSVLRTEDILRNVTNISQNRLPMYVPPSTLYPRISSTNQSMHEHGSGTANASDDESSEDDGSGEEDENTENTATHDKKKFYVRNFITLQRD